MKNRIAIAISIALLAVVGVVYTAAWADSTNGQNAEDHWGGHFHRGFMARIAKQLDLTDAQKAEIKSIVAAERPTIEPLVRQLAEGHKELRAATESDQFDEAKVRAIAAKQAQTMTDLIVAKARVQSKIYSVLTPEQRAKATQLRERWEERMRERMSHRHAG